MLQAEQALIPRDLGFLIPPQLTLVSGSFFWGLRRPLLVPYIRRTIAALGRSLFAPLRLARTQRQFSIYSSLVPVLNVFRTVVPRPTAFDPWIPLLVSVYPKDDRSHPTKEGSLGRFFVPYDTGLTLTHQHISVISSFCGVTDQAPRLLWRP